MLSQSRIYLNIPLFLNIKKTLPIVILNFRVVSKIFNLLSSQSIPLE